MAQSKTADATISSEPKPLSHPCPCCGGRMIIIDDIPARLLAALPSCGTLRRDQDRHIIIKVGSRRHSSAALLMRRLSTGNVHARRRAALDSPSSINPRRASPVMPIAIGRPSSSPRPLPKLALNAPRQ
jgi:hypothetical protein